MKQIILTLLFISLTTMACKKDMQDPPITSKNTYKIYQFPLPLEYTSDGNELHTVIKYINYNGDETTVWVSDDEYTVDNIDSISAVRKAEAVKLSYSFKQITKSQ